MHRQVFRNVFLNVTIFLFNVVTGLYLTPFLIKYLGLEVYGILPLALFLTFYIGVITQALTASVNRFFIANLQTNNIKEANVVFNTAFCIIVTYSVLQFALLYYPIQNIDQYFSIPTHSRDDARRLFESVLLSFSLALLTSIFSVSLFALNRLDLIQCVQLIKIIIKFITIILFFEHHCIGIQFVGIAMILSELIALILTICLWRKLTPEINLKLFYFSKKKVGELSKFAMWLIIDQVGYVLFIKMDLLLVNKFFGAKESGRYSIATQFSDLLRSFAGLMAGVLAPVIMILHAKNELERIVTVTKTFVMILSLTIAIPISIICVFSQELIHFWLGQDINIQTLIWIVTFPLIINLGVLPLFSINVAFKKVKLPSILNIVLALVGVFVSIILIRNTELGLLAVAAGFSFSLTLKNAVFIPIYAALNLRIDKLTFLTVHVRTILFTFFYVCFLILVKSKLSSNLYGFLAELTVLIIFGFIISIFFYSRDERKYITNTLSDKLKAKVK
ncbi:TPA: O69 family O-antigen flippase [Escherichia coli]